MKKLNNIFVRLPSLFGKKVVGSYSKLNKFCSKTHWKMSKWTFIPITLGFFGYQKVTLDEEELIQELEKRVPFHQILDPVISYPRTISVVGDLDCSNACAIKYDDDFKFDKSDLTTINNRELQRWIREVLKTLFPEKNEAVNILIPDPNRFDNIIVRYHSVPILIAKNTKPSSGYSIDIEMTSVIKRFKIAIDRELEHIKR